MENNKMNVFLRIRPFSQVELDRNESQSCVEIQSSLVVLATAPKDSRRYKAQAYYQTFTFSKVFPEMTTQKEFFDCTMLKLVQDFIEGQSCLVFTYGVPNSGKTYTMQGNPNDAGVLPRALDVLFNSINGKQWPRMNLKPKMFSNVVQLSSEEEEKEKKLKEHMLKLNSTEHLDVTTLLGEDASDKSVMNALEQADVDRKGLLDSSAALQKEIENRVHEETALDVTVPGKSRFSVWVSFAEVYNEQIFDLLEPVSQNNDFKRPALKVADDTNGNSYVKGLKEINVSSADEAYKLLTIGQRNLRTACTKLNQCSSRSHCIFNIKLIRVQDIGQPEKTHVSVLSLCDLAGSERQTKTCAGGERLKEAGNINTSLFTLGRCMDLLRSNQNVKRKEQITGIPFRESQLTHLFQNFFCGRVKGVMIVNVSQCASTFDETFNVFEFSAIAKHVMTPKLVEKPMEMPAEPKRSTQAPVGNREESEHSCSCALSQRPKYKHSRTGGPTVSAQSQKRESNLRKELQAYAERLDKDKISQLEEELAKSQKRESNLRKELQAYAERLDKDKISQLEEELAKNDEHNKEHIAQQETANQRMQKIITKLSELVQSKLSKEQQQRNIADENVKACEQKMKILQQKNTMIEMEAMTKKLKTVLDQNDLQIQSLHSEDRNHNRGHRDVIGSRDERGAGGGRGGRDGGVHPHLHQRRHGRRDGRRGGPFPGVDGGPSMMR